MKKIITFIIIILFCLIPIKINSKKLSTNEKIEDFNLLYKTIKDNYPFLDVNKRVYGIDWLADYDNTIQKIKLTKNDLEFFDVLDLSLKNLNNSHTKILTSDEVNTFLQLYSKNENTWQYKIIKPVLDNKKVLKRYNIDNSNIEKETPANMNISIINMSTKDIVSNKIGYISIPMMLSLDFIERDNQILNKYLPNIKDYQALIIDIRGNIGGDSRYWSEFLLPKIINKSYTTSNYKFWKNGDLLNKFFKASEVLKEADSGKVAELDSSSLVNLPNEIFKEFEYYLKFDTKINPNKDSIKFAGNIYLLIDKYVYSSAESFASFSQNSNFATLIGEKTGGDGLGSDPLFVMLPNSNFVFKFSKDMAVDSTGKCNEEFKTLPHYEISQNLFEDLAIQKVLELENIK